MKRGVILKHIELNSLVVSVCSLCLLLTVPAFSLKAQQKDTTSRRLKEVHIQSQNLPQIQTITPAQQIGSTDFLKVSARTVADALKDFSGVSIKDYGGMGGLKTISVRSLGANQTITLYDGVQLNDVANGQVDLGRFNLENIQSITLYNGQPPQLCQTARAFSATSVLAIVPIHPSLTVNKPYQISAGIKTGSFGLFNPYLQWQQRLNNRWSLVLNGNYEYANGQYHYRVTGDGQDTLSTRKNAGIKAFQTEGALYWKKNDSNRFSIRINNNNTNQGLPGAIIYYNSQTGQHLWDNALFAQANYERLWVNGLHLLLNSKFSADDTHYIDPTFLNQQGLNEWYHQKEFYQSAVLSYYITRKWEASFATDVAWDHLSSNLYSYAYPLRFTLLNVLATGIDIGRLRLQGSVLHTYVHETVKSGNASPDKSIYSPTIMATWKPAGLEGFLFRAFYKNIFRLTTFNELYYTPIGNRNIKPEYADQYDLGMVYNKAFSGFFQYLSFSADGYYNRVKDKIVAVPGQNLFIWTIQNIGKTDIAGVDFGLKTATKTINNFKASLAVNYTYQSALITTNPADGNYLSQLAYTPKNLVAVNLGLNYRNAGLYYNQVWSSQRYYLNQSDPQDILPAYNLSDLAFNYRITQSRQIVNITVEINNVFDARYEVIRSFPMPGRSFRIGLQLTI